MSDEDKGLTLKERIKRDVHPDTIARAKRDAGGEFPETTLRKVFRGGANIIRSIRDRVTGKK